MLSCPLRNPDLRNVLTIYRLGDHGLTQPWRTQKWTCCALNAQEMKKKQYYILNLILFPFCKPQQRDPMEM